MQEILAGNATKLTKTFTRDATVTQTVEPSTVEAAVTAPDGTSTALTVSTSYVGDVGNRTAVVAEATWTIADTAAQGVYVISWDVSGNMVAADEDTIAVIARRLAVLP